MMNNKPIKQIENKAGLLNGCLAILTHVSDTLYGTNKNLAHMTDIVFDELLNLKDTIESAINQAYREA